MEIWIASDNKGKIDEYKILFSDIPNVKLHVQSEIPGFTPRPEDGKTFLDNARIKAKTLKAVKSGVWILGDDTGLEVEGLNNLPGIHTARYAGPKASMSENIAKLLKMMSIRPMPNRNARFVCQLVIFTPDGEEWLFDGDIKGTIAFKQAGVFGFGYDSIFIPNNQTLTMAELGDSFKNKHSHRAVAVEKFVEKLRSVCG